MPSPLRLVPECRVAVLAPSVIAMPPTPHAVVEPGELVARFQVMTSLLSLSFHAVHVSESPRRTFCRAHDVRPQDIVRGVTRSPQSPHPRVLRSHAGPVADPLQGGQRLGGTPRPRARVPHKR